MKKGTASGNAYRRTVLRLALGPRTELRAFPVDNGPRGRPGMPFTPQCVQWLCVSYCDGRSGKGA